MNNEHVFTNDSDDLPYLSHKSAAGITYQTFKKFFTPKYYKKITQSNGKPRYFYSEKEYSNYLNRNNRPKSRTDIEERKAREAEQKEKDRKAKQRYELAKQQAERDAQKKREEAIDKAKRKEANERQEAYEAAAAEVEKKRKELADRKKLPDKVSLKDYLFGGQFKKDLKSSKKNLKKTERELQRQNKQRERLDEQIEKLSEKADRLSGRARQKLERLQKQRSELQSAIEATRAQQRKNFEDFTVAMYRYEGATLVGQIGKKVKSSKRKASNIIEKYSKTALSAIPKISIKLKK